MVHSLLGLALLLSSLAAGREITFPPVSGFLGQEIIDSKGIDITTGSAFAGLMTYANLPYVHCLAGDDEDIEKYDIAILGAPFDTVGPGHKPRTASSRCARAFEPGQETL